MNRRRKQKEMYYTEILTASGLPLFIHPLISKKLTDGLKWSCENRGLRIYDYVILADRMIMIANTAWGNLNDVLDSYLEFSSKAVMLILRNGDHRLKTSWMVSVIRESGSAGSTSGPQIWSDQVILKNLFRQDEIDEASKRIHGLPVELGWVTKPEHYRNSSACPFNPLDGWIVEAVDPWS
jgi:putative transposase